MVVAQLLRFPQLGLRSIGSTLYKSQTSPVKSRIYSHISRLASQTAPCFSTSVSRWQTETLDRTRILTEDLQRSGVYRMCFRGAQALGMAFD